MSLYELIIKWRSAAIESNREAERIRKTIKLPTDAEARCYVRAELWNKCAEELEAIIKETPTYQSYLDNCVSI